MINLLIIPICALMNRARGSAFWGLESSTVLSRIMSMGVIAIACGVLTANIFVLLVVFTGLMLWCTPAWDYIWGACIGQSTHSRLWGFCMFLWRGMLIYPTFAALGYLGYPAGYYLGVFGCLQSIPYIIGSYVYKRDPVAFGECVWGAIIGLMFFITLGV